MKFYSCLWTNPLLSNKEHYQQYNLLSQKPKEYFSLIEKSFDSFKNLYEDVAIFCDPLAIEYIKKYTTISKQFLIEKDFNIPKEYSEIWSLAKIFCYLELAKKGDPFCFFDLDTVIHRKLHEEFLNSEIFAYDNVARRLVQDWFYKDYISFILKNKNVSNNEYILDLFKGLNELTGIGTSIVDTRHGKNIREYDTFVPNCAIVGGKNMDIFYNFASNSINNVLDEQNKSFWIDFHKEPDLWSKACIAEQLLLGLEIIKFSKNKKIKIEPGIHSSGQSCCKYYNFFSGSKKTPKTVTHVGGYKQLILYEDMSGIHYGKKNIDEIISLSHSL